MKSGTQPIKYDIEHFTSRTPDGHWGATIRIEHVQNHSVHYLRETGFKTEDGAKAWRNLRLAELRCS